MRFGYKAVIRAYPMVVLLLPLVAAILFFERTGVFYPPDYEEYDSLYIYTFVLKSEARPTERCERFEAETSCGRVLLYCARDSSVSMPQKGDTLIATTRIRRPDSIGTFDYRTYLLRQGIIGTAYIGKHSAVSVRHADVTPRPSLQKRLYRRLSDAGLTGDELATTGALTLGYKEDLDPELKRRFQDSGAAHVLAVSGLHTGILYALLMTLLTLGGRYRPLYENRLGRAALSLTVIAVMWGYALLTGMTPSVVRAVLMVTIVEAGRIIYRNSLTLNSVAAAAVLILIVRPLDLWSLSFQLSFTATAAIVVLARKAEKLFRKRALDGTWYGRLASWFFGTVIISLAAQLGTLPITIHTFGQVSTYFLLTNLIVLPVAGLLVPCGLVSLVLGGTSAGVLFSKVTWALAWLMNHSVGRIESLPGSTFPAYANGWMVGVYYVIFILFCLFWGNSRQNGQKKHFIFA
jgi:competence protein ComEC